MTEVEEIQALATYQRDALAGFSALDHVRMHSKTRQAIEAMVHEGFPLNMAADRFGIRRDNFARTMQRPEVRQAYNRLLSAIRDNAAQAAYMRINDMALNAKSERVRLKANEWIAGVDGIAKVHRLEGHMRHDVIFGGFEYPTLAADYVSPDEE